MLIDFIINFLKILKNELLDDLEKKHNELFINKLLLIKPIIINTKILNTKNDKKTYIIHYLFGNINLKHKLMHIS